MRLLLAVGCLVLCAFTVTSQTTSSQKPAIKSTSSNGILKTTSTKPASTEMSTKLTGLPSTFSSANSTGQSTSAPVIDPMQLIQQILQTISQNSTGPLANVVQNILNMTQTPNNPLSDLIKAFQSGLSPVQVISQFVQTLLLSPELQQLLGQVRQAVTQIQSLMTTPEAAGFIDTLNKTTSTLSKVRPPTDGMIISAYLKQINIADILKDAASLGEAVGLPYPMNRTMAAVAHVANDEKLAGVMYEIMQFATNATFDYNVVLTLKVNYDPNQIVGRTLAAIQQRTNLTAQQKDDLIAISAIITDYRVLCVRAAYQYMGGKDLTTKENMKTFLNVLLTTPLKWGLPNNGSIIQQAVSLLENDFAVDALNGALTQIWYMVYEGKTPSVYMLFEVLVPRSMGMISSVSPDCLSTLVTIASPQRPKDTEFVVQLLDSWGKPGAGIMIGGLDFIGSYKQCQNAKGWIPTGNGTAGQMVKGSYCHVGLSLPPALQQLGAPPGTYLGLGVCLPQQCSKDDATTIVNAIAQPLGSAAYGAVCPEPAKLEEHSSAVAFIVFLGIVASFCLLSTAIDYYYIRPKRKETATKSVKAHVNGGFEGDGITLKAVSNSENNGKAAEMSDVKLEEKLKEANHVETASLAAPYEPGTLMTLVIAFSLYTNLPKLMAAKHSKSSLPCLNGLRVMSMAWVILGHTYSFLIVPGFPPELTNNKLESFQMFSKWHIFFIKSALYAVDTFFFLSGFLVTYLLLKDLSRVAKGKLGRLASSVPVMILHRYIRLTPLMLVIMMWQAYISPLSGSGPLFISSGAGAENCQKYWWRNILYINNFFPIAESCIGWVWYLPNDFQFFLVAPLLASIFLWKPVVGILVNVLTVLISCSTRAGLLHPFIYDRNQIDPQADSKHFDDVYDKPWTRYAPYGVGIIAGYLVFTLKKKRPMPWVAAGVGWLLCTALGLTLVFVEHSRAGCEGCYWTKSANLTYEAMKRGLWAIVLGWIVLACTTQRGAVVNSLLSWRAFVPLSRLTYGAYLVHPIIMFMFYTNSYKTIYQQDWFMTLFFLGFLVLAYFTAIFFSLMFESPIAVFDKLLIGKLKSLCTKKRE